MLMEFFRVILSTTQSLKQVCFTSENTLITFIYAITYIWKVLSSLFSGNNFIPFFGDAGSFECAGFSLVTASGGYSLVEVHSLPIAVASLVQSGL